MIQCNLCGCWYKPCDAAADPVRGLCAFCNKPIVEVPELIIPEVAKQYVVHCQKAPYDIYIGRPSKWGNPFEIGRDGSREEVIAKYEEYLRGNTDLLSCLNELIGKVLGCWCAPKACHGHVLVKLILERFGGL